MESALKYVVIIILLIVVTVVIIGLLSVWTGQSSDMASGIVKFFQGINPGDIGGILKTN
jgi:flagellar basal body-associated protein FliL